MKKLGLFMLMCALLICSSCKLNEEKKQVRYMGITFKPLSRNDFTLINNLSSEATVTGKGAKLDKVYRNARKQGIEYKRNRYQTIYFSPPPGEVYTGTLFDDDLINSINQGMGSQRLSPAAKLRARQRYL